MSDAKAARTLRLGENCLKIGSGATPRGGKEAYLSEGPFSLIRSQNILNERFSFGGLAYISQTQADQLSNVDVRAGDVLLNITGDSVARVCQVDPAVLPARVNQHVAIIRPDPEVIDPRFLRYFLVSQKMQAHMLGLAASGATRNALTKSMIEKFEVPWIPLPEQRAIAATLGALDDKIELNRKMNATLEAMARALFRDWFVDFGPTRAKMAGLDPYLSPDLWSLFPDRLDAEGKPEGWDVGTMSDLFTLQRGFDLPSKERREGTFPILAASGPSGFHEHFMVKGPGVTTGRSGVLGRVFYVQGDFWPLNTSLWVKDYKRATPLYAYHFLSLIDLSGFNAGSAVPTLNRNHIHGLPAVLPPRRLVAEFDCLADSLMKRHHQNKVENETHAQTRDLLLPRLMSGELRVAEAERFAGEVA